MYHLMPKEGDIFIACRERICINSLNHLTLFGAWSDRYVPLYPER